MRKVIGVSMALMLLLGAALTLVAGCSGGKQSGSGTQGSTSSISQSELEALVYPGAEEEDLGPGGGMRPPDGSSAPAERPEGMPEGSAPPMSSDPGSRGGPGGPGTMSAYWTGDSVDKVSAWYAAELSEETGYEEMTVPARGGSGDSGQDASMKAYSCEVGGVTVMVMLRTDTQERGGTVITIGEAPEGMPSAPPDGQSQ